MGSPQWNGIPDYGSQHRLALRNQTKAMVLRALSLGITNIDVHLGGSERDGVAAVLRQIDRDEMFLVTKIDKPPADMTDPEAAARLVRDTVDKEWPLLGVDTVDVLLLKDSASCPVMQAQWAVLESLLEEGKARALGTYNYCQFSLDCLLRTAVTPPAFNYVMRHVGMGVDATGLVQYSESQGVRTVAYGTLGEPVALAGLLTAPTLMDIAAWHGRSVEDVALRWNVQSGYAVSNRLSADYAPDNCEMDIWSEKQATLPPAVSKLKGFMIEMSFEYPGEDGGQCLDWYRGQVVEVLNKEKFRTRIKWDRDTLAEGDAASSVHILLPGHWNPRKIRKGGWREYRTE